LLLLLSVVSARTPATAQTPDIAGHYRGDVILESTGGEGALLCGGFNGTIPAEADVQLTGDNVSIQIEIVGEGGGFTIDSSLDQELGVYSEVRGAVGSGDQVFPFSGQFDVSGSQPSFSGSQLSRDRCEIPGDPPTFTIADSTMTVAMVRVSGGGAEPATGVTSPGATPPSTVGDSPPGLALSDRLAASVCRDLLCDEARNYGLDWEFAMGYDISRLALDNRSDAALALEPLRRIAFRAAMLGGLLVDSPGGRVSRFPVVHALLPVFAHLVVQGVTLAGTGRIDSLRATVAQADDLLFAALAEETRTGLP
jgi:hypothetical protein